MNNTKIIVAAGLIGVGIGILLAQKKGNAQQKSLLASIEELGGEMGTLSDKILGMVDKIKTGALGIEANIETRVEQINEGVSDLKTTSDHIKTIFS